MAEIFRAVDVTVVRATLMEKKAMAMRDFVSLYRAEYNGMTNPTARDETERGDKTEIYLTTATEAELGRTTEIYPLADAEWMNLMMVDVAEGNSCFARLQRSEQR